MTSDSEQKSFSHFVFTIYQFCYRYFYTIFCVYFKRNSLSSENINSSNTNKFSPLSPLYFIGISFFLSATVEKSILNEMNKFELPAKFSGIENFIDVIPQKTVGVFILILGFQAALHYIFFSFFRRKITLDGSFNALAYSNGGIVFPFIMISYLFVMPSIYNSAYGELLFNFLQYALLISLIFSLIWVALFISYEYNFYFTSTFFIMMLANAPLMTPAILDLEPREAFYSPTSSMKPTIEVRDIVVVNRWIYHWRKPKRGEVIAFFNTNTPSVQDPYLKRIVGLPGEAVQITNGKLLIDGNLLEYTEIGEYIEPVRLPSYSQRCLSKRKENGSEICLKIKMKEKYKDSYISTVLNADLDKSISDNTKVYNIPEDHYFVLGDNRDNSADSRRSLVSYVPSTAIIGPVYDRYAPAGRKWE